MRKFFADFKKFISRGNIIDLAIGVIIGTAFNAIVSSLVNDIIMPLIGLAMGGKSLSGLVLVLNNQPLHLEDGTLNPAALTWNYGNFIQAIIDFLIVALTLFIILKVAMKSSEMLKRVHDKTHKLTKEDKAALKEKGVSLRDKVAVQAYIDEKTQKEQALKTEEEAKAKLAEEEKYKNSTEYLLKEILATMKEGKEIVKEKKAK